MEIYLCYTLLDYDIIEGEYVLEVYDFKDGYYDVKTFKSFAGLVNYYQEELLDILQVSESNILQITTNSYQRKLGINEYKSLDEEELIKCFKKHRKKSKV